MGDPTIIRVVRRFSGATGRFFSGIALLVVLAGCGEDGSDSQASGMNCGASGGASGAGASGGTAGSGQAGSGGGAAGSAGTAGGMVETPAGGDVQQGILYDGASGVTKSLWNVGQLLSWKNSGGDFRDRKDSPQGSEPFASAKVEDLDMVQTATFDATALVRIWLEKGNSGALVKTGSGACYIGSREDEEALRPRLLVTTKAGETIDCPCTADARLNKTTESALGPQNGLGVDGANESSALQFDLSKIKGEISEAKFSLVSTAQFGACDLQLMRLDPPGIYAGGGPSSAGVAKDFPYDQNIASHPDVVFATDFAGDAWKTKYFTEGDIANPTFQQEPELKSTSIRSQFVPGELWASTLDYHWTRHGQPEPEDIYFRYYVLLEEDWGSTIDGNKMPGLAGRYGYFTGEYWNPECGNGGSATTGLVQKSGTLRCGWSTRGAGFPEPDDSNPYREFTPVGNYVYHADMPQVDGGGFGEHKRWGTSLLKRNRWYSIEQHVKMNSVDGPFDEFQNGTGRKDGVLEVWVDGLKVLEETSLRFRHNPLIKIDEVWLNWYHGGVQPAVATHHFRMSNVVVARSYIGPIAH